MPSKRESSARVDYVPALLRDYKLYKGLTAILSWLLFNNSQLMPSKCVEAH